MGVWDVKSLSRWPFEQRDAPTAEALIRMFMEKGLYYDINNLL